MVIRLDGQPCTIDDAPVVFLPRVMGEKEYIDRVLDYSPIAYWPQNEAAGATINCMVNPLQNGTYVGVDLGQPGIGDGNTAPYYDGVNDYGQLLTATLISNFNGAEGSAMIWFYPMNAWKASFTFHLYGTAGCYVAIRTLVSPTRFYYIRYAPVSASSVIEVVPGTLNTWYCLGVSWSESANQFKAYRNGNPVGITQPCAGVWGANTLTRALIGSFDNPTAQGADGRPPHFPIWDIPIGDPVFADLAVV